MKDVIDIVLKKLKKKTSRNEKFSEGISTYN